MPDRPVRYRKARSLETQTVAPRHGQAVDKAGRSDMVRSAGRVEAVEAFPQPACGRSSVVERQLPKLNVVGSIPIARSN